MDAAGEYVSNGVIPVFNQRSSPFTIECLRPPVGNVCDLKSLLYEAQVVLPGRCLVSPRNLLRKIGYILYRSKNAVDIDAKIDKVNGVIFLQYHENYDDSKLSFGFDFEKLVTDSSACPISQHSIHVINAFKNLCWTEYACLCVRRNGCEN